MVLPIGYKIKKAAQVVAYFAMQEGEAEINVLKLVKLIYLSDREHLKRYDSPILHDKFVSMPHGPVNSVSYSFIAGCQQDNDWDAILTDRALHCVGLKKRGLSIAELDELSEAEIEVLESVWNQFGGMTGFQLVDWTHENCLEWEDPQGSSDPIPYSRVLKNLHKTDIEALSVAIEQERSLFDF